MMLNESFQIRNDYSLNSLIRSNRKNITKKQIAAKLGISLQWFNHILKEEEQMKLSTLEQILSILDYTLDVRISRV